MGLVECGCVVRTVREKRESYNAVLGTLLSEDQGEDSPEAHILSHLPAMAVSRMGRPSLSKMGMSWSAGVVSVLDGNTMGRISEMIGSSDDMAENIQQEMRDQCHSRRPGTASNSEVLLASRSAVDASSGCPQRVSFEVGEGGVEGEAQLGRRASDAVQVGFGTL